MEPFEVGQVGQAQHRNPRGRRRSPVEKEQVHVRMSVALADRLRGLAALENRTLNNQIVFLLERSVGQ
jgi:hypothetical protein